MKPEAPAPSNAPEGDQRRRVRLFVALQLGAVGATYALALIVGGGFEGPPMPPLTVASATAPDATLEPKQRVPAPPANTMEVAPLPAWAQRVEIIRPWESR